MTLLDRIRKVKKQLKLLDRYDIVSLKWEDIVSDVSWVSDEGIKEATTATCYSIGFLMQVEESYIKVSSSYDFENESGSVEVIPIGCILSVTRLETEDE